MQMKTNPPQGINFPDTIEVFVKSKVRMLKWP